jgi:site-specific DNA-methyltransferase (adenine-specific)
MKTEQAVVYHGNCLDELKNIPDNYVDAIVTDPPYGLGDSDPNYIIDALKMWMGEDRAHIPAGKGFMGKQWDAFVPPPAVWDECFRVLKPGGYVLVFAGTRTVDLMGLSVRMAGFEIRDSLTWIYGQGFPKSLDISKALDKMAGAEREVLGRNPNSRENATKENTLYESGTVGKTDYITAPSTDAAKQWAGWGTALKPASEPIIMARKPLSEKTVAKNVLKWGTGGINIDGTRIGTEERTDKITENGFGANFMDDGCQPSGKTYEKTVTGRFPSNVMFSHADDCVQVGIIGNSYVINKTEEWSGFGQKERPDYESESKTVDVPIYECVEGCPVKELDEQSGIRPGGAYPAKRGQAVNTSFASGQETVGGARQMGDTGGASRFFYVAKASKKDRNEGLDDLPTRRASAMGYDIGLGEAGEGMFKDRNPQKQNFHPTVKPTSLMRQLVKMVAPEGAIILDPFAGSGSTGKASVLEGRRFIGIEMTDEYLPIIQGRLEHAIEQRKGTKE